MMKKEINLSKAYTQEKLGNVIKYLSSIADMFNKGTIIINKDNDNQRIYEEECKEYNKRIIEENVEESNFTDFLNYALSDTLKILSFATEAQWETEDSEIIMEKGEEGLKEIENKYKL